MLQAKAALTEGKQLLPPLLRTGPYHQTPSRQLYQGAGATPTRDAAAPRLQCCAGAQQHRKQQAGWGAASSAPGVSVLPAGICLQLRTGILRERRATGIQADFLYPSLLPLPVIDKMLQLTASAPDHRLPSAPGASFLSKTTAKKKKSPQKDNSSSHQALSTSPRKHFLCLEQI